MKGTITIGRPSYGNGDKFITITLTDEASHARFARVKIGYAEFAEALTGLSETPIEFEVAGLDVVGKQKIRENRSVTCPDNTLNRDDLKAWLIENCQEEGWHLDSYLGSQSSISHSPAGTHLHYAVYRFEPAE